MTDDDNGVTFGQAPEKSARPGWSPPWWEDPTKNVLSLVAAQAKFDEAMRTHERTHRDVIIRSLEQFQTTALIAEAKRQDGLRDAETRRVNDLAQMKKEYDKQIGESQTVQLKTTSDLVSTQLDKVTSTLANQIREAATTQYNLMTTQSERIAKLEQFRYELGGRSSVADPAIAAALLDMNKLVLLQNQTRGRSEGLGMSISAVVQIISSLAAVAAIIVAIIAYSNIHPASPGLEPHWDLPKPQRHIIEQPQPLWPAGELRRI